MPLNFAEIDTRPSVTTFAIRYANDDVCSACFSEFDLDDEACYIDDALTHYSCVEDDYQRRTR